MVQTLTNKLSSRAARFVIDGLIVMIGLALAYLARYDGAIPPEEKRQLWLMLVPIAVGRLVTQFLFGMHKHKWRYISMVDATRIVEAYASFSVLLLVLRLALPPGPVLDVFRLPIGVIAMEFMLSLVGTIALRALRRWLDRHWSAVNPDGATQRILLVGAGSHGITVANEMVRSGAMQVVGFVDDDRHKIGAMIAGLPVLGPISSLTSIVESHKVDRVLICIPPSARGNLSIELPKDLSVRTRIVPTVDEIISADAAFLSFPEIRASGPPAPPPKSASPIRGYPRTSIRNKTILITGGGGFIGSTLADILADDNEVILLDLAFREKPVEFTRLLHHPNVRPVQGSLLDDDTDVRSLCQKADMVVHAAALVGVSRVCHAGRETLETNYVGTSRLLQAIEGSSRLERLIYFSTSEVFGVNSFRVDENSPPSVGPIAEARWSYAIAKLAGEHLVKAYFRETGMPITIVRPFNVFGPRRTGEHAMSRFILNALAGKPLEIHGDGSQIRSWCYIDDFCSALIGMLERPEAIGEDFNIGNSSNTLTICELARKVIELSETDSRIKFIEHPFPDISIRVPSLTKAQNLLEYKPRYDLDTAIRLTIDWYRENLDFFVKQGSVAVAFA